MQNKPHLYTLYNKKFELLMQELILILKVPRFYFIFFQLCNIKKIKISRKLAKLLKCNLEKQKFPEISQFIGKKNDGSLSKKEAMIFIILQHSIYLVDNKLQLIIKFLAKD